MPLLEAMNYRLPIFASNIDVFKEVAGETINYFDPYTFDDLADRINKLKRTRNLLNLMQEFCSYIVGIIMLQVY